MTDKVAIISVDGHVKAPRAAYLDYLDPPYRAEYEEALRAVDDTPDGFVHAGVGEEAQWDAARRVADLETQGVVAEVLFPNGEPFDAPRADYSPDPARARASNMAYNRWLIDFCSQVPSRLCGLAAVSFDDIDQAVKDILWAKESGFGGILMPALHPGSPYFFDPVLDPVWAVCEETGLVLNQHGGTGAPKYEPLSFASFMVLAAEHSFFSGRSLWQLILGGVFDRFPNLRIAYIETEQWWIAPMMEMLDRRETVGDDWSDFADTLGRLKPYKRLPSSYWESNCAVGLSPFAANLLVSDGSRGDEGFAIRPDNAMVGIDYPHPETIFPRTYAEVRQLVEHPSVTDVEARAVLYGNAAELYGFDLADLGDVIGRVGFALDDVPEAPDALAARSLFEVVPTLLEHNGVTGGD